MCLDDEGAKDVTLAPDLTQEAPPPPIGTAIGRDRRMTTLADWVEAGVGAMKEVGTTVLGCGEVEVLRTFDGLDGGTESGAFLPLIGDEVVELGLLGPEASCTFAARSLLGMGPEEEMPPGDVADACCEILNIASGLVKAHPSGVFEPMKTGLPLFVRGQVVFHEGVLAATAELSFDGVPLSLVVVLRGEAASHRATT